MAYAIEIAPEPEQPLEIPTFTLFKRVYGVIVAGTAGGLMLLLARSQPSRGHEIGYAMAALLFWWALYFALQPRVKVRLDAFGIEFADLTWSAFFLFPRHHVFWRDVLDIETRRIVSKYGWYFRTRVKVCLPESPKATRRFTVTSRQAGYYEFLRRLNLHLTASGATVRGLGIDPAEFHAASRRLIATQLKLVAWLVVTAAGLALVVWLTNR
jgi:hypothetical protein